MVGFKGDQKSLSRVVKIFNMIREYIIYQIRQMVLEMEVLSTSMNLKSIWEYNM